MFSLLHAIHQVMIRQTFSSAILAITLLIPHAATAKETFEVRLWEGVAPGSEGVQDKEKVVERGDGEKTIDRSISDTIVPTLTVHLPEKSLKPVTAVIIVPGGGLTRAVIDKEGNDLARVLAETGVAGIVLKFRNAQTTTAFNGIDIMEADIRRAIRVTRFHADKWNIASSRIGTFGFSAGGIVAVTPYIHPVGEDPEDRDRINRLSSEVAFFAGAYPLLSMQTDVAGPRYQKLLFGENPTKEQLDNYSAEFHLKKGMPPVFLAHALDDKGVLAENSLRMAKACKKAGIPVQTFFRDTGGHGYGIRDLGQPINKWVSNFKIWIQEQ